MTAPFADSPVVLTDDECRALQVWVDETRPRLALSDWSITVSRHQTTSDAIASSFVRDHADISVIALGSECHSWSADEMRQNLTHELLHPHFQRVTALAGHLIEHELGKRTEAVIEAAVREVEEQTIDRLATAIARFLPLPRWPVESDEPGYGGTD